MVKWQNGFVLKARGNV